MYFSRRYHTTINPSREAVVYPSLRSKNIACIPTSQLYTQKTKPKGYPNPSKPFHSSPDSPLHRQRYQILTNTDIHQPNPHALIDDIPTFQPLPKTLLARPSPHFDLPHARLLDHQELPNLHQMLRRDPRLDDFARLPQTRFQRINNDDAAFIRMPVMMVFVVRFDGMAQDVGMNLTHVWTIAAYQTYVSPFLSAFGAGEVLGREERGGARRAEEDGICLADVFLQQSLILAVLGGDDTERQFRIRVAEIFPFGRAVEFVHELFGTGKGAVDDVDVVDRGPTEHESEAYVPFRLQA